MTTKSTSVGALFGLSPSELARELSPENFELLVQAYLRGHLERQGIAQERGDAHVILSAMLEHNGAQWSTWEWQIGTNYSKAGATKGEIFELCVKEQSRRLGFAQACTLRQIEAPALALDDEIPF